MNFKSSTISFLFAVFLSCLYFSQAKKVKSEEDCEVCVKFIRKFQDTLSSDQKNDMEKIKNAFVKYCKNKKGKDERFCYYVGGMETSATGIVNEMARPVSIGMPPEKVCEKLSMKDSQICDLKYEKQLDLANTNLKKLKVKDLKKILSNWDETCKGCAEKSDFIRRIEDLMPEYDPEAHKKRQAAKSEL